uniref:Uncharacterized protein n=1 Tax=Caulobacter sp. (strain K31) TaxID=366602 RepID=B0T944_CAUSK
MPRFLVSYDVSAGHDQVLDAGLERGWLYVFQRGRTLYRLPNTTLWGVFSSGEVAVLAFQEVVAAARSALGAPLTLRKSAVMALPPVVHLTSDVSKTPDPLWMLPSEPDDYSTCRLHQLFDPDFARAS